ncbi:MAG: YebC/PmpR family DNA-binding transcriptional regulator [Rikenellaceae bacterium]
MGRAFEYRKATKMKRWGNMARTFTRIGRQIEIAVKEGGPSAENNPHLRACVANAKAANMPKENVERAIKRAVSKDAGDYKEMTYEGYAPFGVAVFIDSATDNSTRTVANIRSYFNKAGGSLGTSGSLDFLFERKSVFRVAQPEGLDLDELELEVIDCGVDEIDANDGEIVMSGAFESYGTIHSYIESHNMELLGSEFVRFPLNSKEVTEEQRAAIEKLIDKIEDDDDVVSVFTNMAPAED